MNNNCCNHYKGHGYVNGYVMFPIFTVRMCRDCDEVEMTCNWFLSFIFEHILSLFWDGSVCIEDFDD